MTISIFAVMSEKIVKNRHDDGHHIQTETEQVAFAGEWKLDSALARAAEKHPDAIRYVVADISSDNAGGATGPERDLAPGF